MLQKISQAIFQGVSWQHPVVAAGLKVLDPIDKAVRLAVGRGKYPPMSIRVRSNGLRKQFNGRRFEELGGVLTSELANRAGMKPDSDILEIGCGCGRFAFALAPQVEDGAYTGIDIDAPSIDAAKSNSFLSQKKFEFRHLDVHNAEYNPGGKVPASEYRFEFEDGSFDVVFLVSVFTHMLPADVKNYIKEIGRLLRPGGHLMLTTFVMDAGTTFDGNNFVYGSGPYRSSHPEMHEICVGYFLDFLDECLTEAGLERTGAPVYSAKGRQVPDAQHTDFGQDLVIARKP
ncbi:MAG: methyltransferase [Erythrobacter sp.]